MSNWDRAVLAMSERTILVWIGGVGSGADVYVDDVTPPGGHRGTTDAQGMVPFQVTTLPNSYIRIKAEGFKDYEASLVLKPVNLQVRVGVATDPARPQDVILPALSPLAPATLPSVRAGRFDFFTEHGDRHVIVGSTELMLAWRYDAEGPDATRAVFEQRHACKFNNLRVLWQKDIGNAGVPWQMPLAKLRPFLSLAMSYQFYVEGCILADCAVVNPNESDQRVRVSAVRSETVGVSNLFEQLGNEWEKNGHDPRHFTKPTDRMATNSSSIEGGLDAPYWDYFTFSGQRSPLNHAIREYGPIEFLYGDRATWGGLPAICGECFKPGEQSSDPRDFERAGAQARSANGGRFHSDAGTKGNSRLFNDLELACAQAFVKGLGS